MNGFTGSQAVLSGWGRSVRSRAMVGGPVDRDRLAELVASRPSRGVLARGAGCSYGDAAQNMDGHVLAPVTVPQLEVDVAAGRLRASASVRFSDVLAAVVPHGLILPVLPGTRHVTIGGAVAADVHGKNQRRDGSIAAWIDEIELIDGLGRVRTLTPDDEGFWATVGGHGADRAHPGRDDPAAADPQRAAYGDRAAAARPRRGAGRP